MKQKETIGEVSAERPITIKNIASLEDIVVDYSDEDIVIIDTIKKLVEPIPTRLNMNLIVVAINGKVTGRLNGQLVELKRNQVVFCPPNVALGDFMMSPDFEFKAMFMTNRILQSFLREKMNVWNEVMYIHKMHVVTMDEEDVHFFGTFYEMLKLSMNPSRFNPYQTEVVQALLRGAFLGLCGRLKEMLPAEPVSKLKHPDTIFQRFLDLLTNVPTKYQTVEYYASQLCITPKYLSVVCKKNSGKTANEWIREQVLEEIRYYLKQTDYSIKMICDLTGFPNTSFFGKYVKQHFGMTPMQLRQQ